MVQDGPSPAAPRIFVRILLSSSTLFGQRVSEPSGEAVWRGRAPFNTLSESPWNRDSVRERCQRRSWQGNETKEYRAYLEFRQRSQVVGGGVSFERNCGSTGLARRRSAHRTRTVRPRSRVHPDGMRGHRAKPNDCSSRVGLPRPDERCVPRQATLRSSIPRSSSIRVEGCALEIQRPSLKLIIHWMPKRSVR